MIKVGIREYTSFTSHPAQKNDNNKKYLIGAGSIAAIGTTVIIAAKGRKTPSQAKKTVKIEPKIETKVEPKVEPIITKAQEIMSQVTRPFREETEMLQNDKVKLIKGFDENNQLVTENWYHVGTNKLMATYEYFQGKLKKIIDWLELYQIPVREYDLNTGEMVKITRYDK